MHFSSPRRLVLVLLAVFSSTTVFAGDSVPLRGAPAPSLEEAARVINAARSDAEGLIKLTHIVNPAGLIYQTITPCRLLDTRNAPGPFGGPIFANGETRTYDPAQGAIVTCGGSSLPDALAWYANITVTGTTFGPSLLTAFPSGTLRPNVATVNWATAGAQVNNSVIVPTGTSSAFDVYVGTSTHVIVDLVGFFIADLSQTGDQLAIITVRANAAAILGQNNSNTNGSHGVGGFASGTGIVHGVQGQISSFAADQSSGVHGIANAGAGRRHGVLGETFATTSDAAGVKGFGSSGGVTTQPQNCCNDIGVYGESRNGFGVVGGSEGTAGLFLRESAAGATLQFAWVATNFGADYAFYASTGDYGGVGAKYFVEPHPEDAGKIIRYISLEGPESGTYFRGRAKLVRGLATIEVPDSFRYVTAKEGLSVQVTPIGEMATVAVVSMDLDRIVVKGSRNVEFFYMVNGVRKAFEGFQPIIESPEEFMPLGADWQMPEYPKEIKERLIRTGIYGADGRPNMETARRLGWDKIWAARSGKELKEKSN